MPRPLDKQFFTLALLKVDIKFLLGLLGEPVIDVSDPKSEH